MARKRKEDTVRFAPVSAVREPSPLIVTRAGVPVIDQAAGVEEFKAACRHVPSSHELAARREWPEAEAWLLKNYDQEGDIWSVTDNNGDEVGRARNAVDAWDAAAAEAARQAAYRWAISPEGTPYGR